MRALMTLLIALLASPLAHAAEVNVSEVEYTAGDVPMKGRLYLPSERDGRVPGVLIVHEWWGQNEHARSQAEKIAALGYAALAVDMYGEGQTADHPDEAGKMAAAVRGNPGVMESRFRSAFAHLATHQAVDADRIAALGYCFGGSVALNMARTPINLKGVISVHGGLIADQPAAPGQIQPRILVLHGGADETITEEQVDAFKEEMESAGADYLFITYDGAPHSFTNPEADRLAEEFDLPIGYDAEAAEQAWDEVKRFLGEVLGPDEQR